MEHFVLEGVLNRLNNNNAELLLHVYICRGYPPEHVPGHTSLMENSENYVPPNSLNYTSVNVTHDDDDMDEDTQSSMQEEFERMKLDDSALSTAVTGRGVKVTFSWLKTSGFS